MVTIPDLDKIESLLLLPFDSFLYELSNEHKINFVYLLAPG